MEVDYEGFSIREYTRNMRSVDVRKCWPFSGEATEDFIHSLLPPITVVKFRWRSNELVSLLAKSPMAADDSNPVFRRKATKGKPKACKKRSIVEIFAVGPQIQERDNSGVLIGSKRKRMQKVVAQKKMKSKNSKNSGDRKFPNKVSRCKEQAFIKVDDGKCSLGNKESPRGVVMSLSRKKAESVTKEEDSEFPISGIVRSDDKSKFYVTQSERNVKFSDQSGEISQPIASSELCCSEMNRLSLSSSKDQSSVNDKIKSNVETSDDSQLETRQQNKFQPAVSERQSSHGPHLSLQKRVNCALELERKENVAAQSIQSSIPTSQPTSADTHCLFQSLFDPLVVEWMQNSVLNRQEYVEEEAVSGFPQGELVEANEEYCTSLDPPSLGTTGSSSRSAENDVLRRNLVDSTKATLAKVGVVQRQKYYPARLGIDETFTENNDGECIQTLHSPVSSLNPTLRSDTINVSAKQDGLNQNLHSRTLLQDIAKDLFRRFCEPQQVVVLDSEFPPIVLNPCCSLESFPPTDKDLSFHESGLEQHQQNSFTISQQEQLLPFPSDHNNVGIELPCPDSTTLSFENSWLGMSEQH